MFISYVFTKKTIVEVLLRMGLDGAVYKMTINIYFDTIDYLKFY